MASEGRGASPSENPFLTGEAVGSRRTPLSNIDLLEGDIADARWGDASLVYAASGLDETAMLDIARRCCALTDGAWVVTLDKPLPAVLPVCGGDGTGEKGQFRVVWQCQVMGCLGTPTVAFVHHRHVAALA